MVFISEMKRKRFDDYLKFVGKFRHNFYGFFFPFLVLVVSDNHSVIEHARKKDTHLVAVLTTIISLVTFVRRQRVT